jgi:hypothetical protein
MDIEVTSSASRTDSDDTKSDESKLRQRMMTLHQKQVLSIFMRALEALESESRGWRGILSGLVANLETASESECLHLGGTWPA